MDVYRSCQSLKGARQAILAKLKGEMNRYNGALKHIEDNGEPDMLHMGGVMAKVFLLWSARRAHTLYEEIEALNTGRDAYEKLYHSRYSI